VTNFITNPRLEIDEIFELPTKHDMLQHVIDLFAWHPFPSPLNP